MRRAERLARRGQVSEAIESLEQALEFGADRYTCYLRLARLYQTRRQWRQAVSAAEKAVAEHPDHLPAREAVIALYMELKDYQRVVNASKELLKLAPRHVPARDALGAAYLGMGDMEAAMRVANDLVRLDPSNPAHHFTRGLLCAYSGALRLAVEEFERVLEMAPEGEQAEESEEQLEALDSFQLQQIFTLALEDPVFRARLLRDSDAASKERGFYLSMWGRQRLQEMVMADLADIEGSGRPNLYH
jgi:tetratricopeptide (TPR) repeat protein